MTHTLHLGDCRDVLATMGDATVDAIVCDPPYELGFMGKSWDASGISYDVTVWAHCLRVLKPGGHLIAFGGSRTYHRLAVAIEDAGFEIRDQIQWIYGSGFPKSHNLRDDWQGWGTALKPAHESAVLARKPFRGTVADTVAQWGTGALNIEGTRITDAGRWPTNVIFDEDAALVLDGQSGFSKSTSGGKSGSNANPMSWNEKNPNRRRNGHSDSGGASRFFYVAKSSKAEREAGLDAADGERANHHPTVKPLALMRYLVRMVTPPNGVVLDPFMGSGSTGCAALAEGFDFVGIDIIPEYVEIARRRLAWWVHRSRPRIPDECMKEL